MTPSESALQRKLLLAAFQMPAVATLVSRKSSITNAFVNTLIPQIVPPLEEIEQALKILGMDLADVRCAYCGDKMTEWDHLRPLVVKQRPTGYISEIANLVPACGKCNQTKGNSSWREWMLSTTARHSPTARGKKDVAERVARLEAYERWRPPTRIDDFEAILGTEEWAAYWRAWEKINADLRECQKVADDLRAKIEKALPKQLRGATVMPIDVLMPRVNVVREKDFPAFPLQGEHKDSSPT
jgi:HNH endonuclease